MAALTLVALAVGCFWALAPMTTSLLYLYPHNWSEADLVRHVWSFRLVQPEWLADPPQYDYLRWAQSETFARLGGVLLGWISGAVWIVRRHMHPRTVARPSPPNPGNSEISFLFHAGRYGVAATEQGRSIRSRV